MSLKNLQGLRELATAAAGRKGKEVLTVPIDEVASKSQVRKKFKNIRELADNMLEEGQQSPISVFPKDERGKYVIRKGERRWRALQMAEIGTIDIIVDEKKRSDLDETAGELIENIQRDDLDALEIAYGLKKFVDENWRHTEIAKRISKSVVYVSTHLSLLKLPECVRKLYEDDICGDTETLNNLRLLYDIDAVACTSVCERAKEEGSISRKESRDALNFAKGKTASNTNENFDSETPRAETAQGLVEPQVTGNRKDQDERELVDPLIASDGSLSLSNKPEENIDPIKPAQPTNKVASPSNPKHQDALPPLPQDKDWRFTEPSKLIVVVHVPIDDEMKRGILLLDRVCKDPTRVWVKVASGKTEKELRVLASEIKIVSIEV